MNETTCLVCFSDFNEDDCIPVVSLCGHTLCRDCSASLRRTPAPRPMPTSPISVTVQCPTCRSIVPFPMATNFSLLSLMATIKAPAILLRAGQGVSISQGEKFSLEEIDRALQRQNKVIFRNTTFVTRITFLRGRYVSIKMLTDEMKSSLLNNSRLLDEYHRIFQQQSAILSEINHPNIVKYFGSAQHDSNSAENVLVYEYLSGGPLSIRFSQLSTTLNEFSLFLSSHRLSLAIDIAKAVAYQHGIHITDWSIENLMNMRANLNQIEVDTQNNQTKIQSSYHKDIRMENVLLSGDMTAKLRNTTVDQLVEDLLSPESKAYDSPYTAPEIRAGEEYGIHCDIYSYGVILLELLCSAPAKQLMMKLSDVQDMNYSEFIELLTQEFGDKFEEIEWNDNEIFVLSRIGKDCINVDLPSRPPSMRIILLDLLQLQYEMVGSTLPLETNESHLQNVITSTLGPQNQVVAQPTEPPPIVQTPRSIRYHTGHYRRYYGGPTNGRWSCCESYERDAEGCQSGTQVRHHPDRNKLWGEGHDWGCCGRTRSADGCTFGAQPDQFLIPIAPNVPSTPPPIPSPFQQTARYHTGHYRRYYGGPTNGRWSCCESYERDAEGCQGGAQARHHPDRNKLWGEGYNWGCCGRSRTSDGCKSGPQQNQFLVEQVVTQVASPPPQQMVSPRASDSVAQTSSPTPGVRYHTGHYRRYYGGPTNGRWSCCESYERDAEGCQSGTQVRHHPDRNKLWGEGHDWGCCGRTRSADGCTLGLQPGQFMVNPPPQSTNTAIGTSPPLSPTNARSPPFQYHTGHFKPYFGGPTNGRWSCCESYDRDAEGCHTGNQVRHHPDRNKLWGEGHNWGCCGNERTAEGCRTGPQQQQFLVEPPSSQSHSNEIGRSPRIIRTPTGRRGRVAPTSSPSQQSALQTLISMGFSESNAQNAIARTDTVEQAIEYLMSPQR